MTKKVRWAALAVVAVAGVVRAGAPVESDVPEPDVSLSPGRHGPVDLVYRVRASAPRLNRRPMGSVRRFVQGVPAEPIDSFVWDGVGSTPISGDLVLEIEPMSNTGFVRADWIDRNGKWKLEATRFLPPHHHASGVRLGSSVHEVDTIINEGTSHNVYLHGDTGVAFPVLPTVFTYLAAWGRAEVTLNRELFANPFEIPTPLWILHLMVTEGVRRADGSVRTITGEVFDPSRAAEGVVEMGDLEVHLTFHDDVFPVTTSIPSLHSFFYHLVFEDVEIEIVQAD